MRFNPNEYVTVNERVEKFYAKFPEGRILTTVVEHDRESGFVLMRAEVYRDPADTLPAATGHASETKGGQGANQTSHIENAETSAVGRALALLGFEVKRGIASREEMQRTQAPTQIKTAPGAPPVKPVTEEDLDTQISELLTTLERESTAFSAWVRKTYTVEGAWYDQDVKLKRELLTYLQGLVEKVSVA